MIILEAWKSILTNNNINFIEDEPLSKHTSWRIGGPALAFIKPKDKDQLITTIKILNQYAISWKVLGNGSNILVSDNGYQGAIISLSEGFNKILIEDTTIVVGAGASLIYVANQAAKKMLSGLEFASGIPGTVGGAISMNAGAYGSDISKVLQSAEVVLENGEIKTWENNDFQFNYRYSRLHKEKAIVLNAVFKLNRGEREKIITEVNVYKERRIKTQPYNSACSGSVFKNPANDYAGRLIEELGIKGYRIGDAQISEIHSNFIVNIGNATSKDVLSLINYIKERVITQYNIELVTEIEMIGF